jgi:NAD(P)-dependent dehydrogenase (short-subunit alcohol dehydrogenase family)
MLDLTGQVVIVTGASGNLGSAISRVLARQGALLAVADRQQAGQDRGRDCIEGAKRMLIAGADVRTREGATRIVAETMARFGRIDALVNTVGTFKMAQVADAAADDWSLLMDLNALSALRLSEAVLAPMRAQAYGRIVHIAAAAGQRSFAGASVYSASKAAVLRITEAVSDENKARGITANCVLPGTLDTPQNRAALPEADPTLWVSPHDVAAVVAFLVSREAAAVTGAAIPVTGRQ